MNSDEEKDVTKKTGLVYAAVISIFISTVTCLLVGLVLDRWLGTGPWLLVGGIVLGSVVGFYQFIRLISRVS